MHPKHGLLRSRQFLMKDLYTFDSTVESATETYQQVSEAYQRLFKKLDLNILRGKSIFILQY